MTGTDYYYKELPDSAYKSADLMKVGTVANLPGLRIDRYYYYVDLYNYLLQVNSLSAKLFYFI
jgi:hypothetical protein